MNAIFVAMHSFVPFKSLALSTACSLIQESRSIIKEGAVIHPDIMEMTSSGIDSERSGLLQPSDRPSTSSERSGLLRANEKPPEDGRPVIHTDSD